MSPLYVLELFASLSMQVTLLTCFAALFTQRNRNCADLDLCWAMLHAGILLLSIAGFSFPHLRIISWGDLPQANSSIQLEAQLHRLGWGVGRVWLTGALIYAALVAVGMLRAMMLVRSAKPIKELPSDLSDWILALDAPPLRVEMRVSEAPISPFCWHIHRPIITLPAGVLNFPLGEQAAIVRHELAHLRLQHPLHLFLQRMVEAMFWFHPLVWWASKQAAAAREFRCDREAVGPNGNVPNYLRSLLRLVQLQLSAPAQFHAGLEVMGNASLLARRANALADEYGQYPVKLAKGRWTIAFALSGLLCLVIWLPINPRASSRAEWSPWPRWTAQALRASGITVRDYEVDGHRLRHVAHRR
jgi:bla regulator protein blaR1